MMLKDKVVLITASTRGIGLACVKSCAREGAAVYMAARNVERAKEIAHALRAEGGNVKWVYNDATEPESFSSMVEDVVYFASDASAYTTGQILTVSGGFGLATPVYGDLASKENKR